MRFCKVFPLSNDWVTSLQTLVNVATHSNWHELATNSCPAVDEHAGGHLVAGHRTLPEPRNLTEAGVLLIVATAASYQLWIW